jgi:hypothetical protein
VKLEEKVNAINDISGIIQKNITSFKTGIQRFMPVTRPARPCNQIMKSLI